jgi:hypothetical protein
MLQKYVDGLAAQKRIQLSWISVVEGCGVGCLDVYLLHLVSAGRLVDVLVYKSELDELKNRPGCERLEFKIQAALSTLSK